MWRRTAITHSFGVGFDFLHVTRRFPSHPRPFPFQLASASHHSFHRSAMGRIGLYSSASAVAAAGMVYYAFSTRQQFFTAVVFLSTSKLSVAVRYCAVSDTNAVPGFHSPNVAVKI